MMASCTEDVDRLLGLVAEFLQRRQIANIRQNLVVTASREALAEMGREAVEAGGLMNEARAAIRESALPIAESIEAAGYDASAIYQMHHYCLMPYASDPPKWEEWCIALRRLKTAMLTIPAEFKSRCMNQADGVRFHYGSTHSNPAKYLKEHPEIRREGSGKKWYFDVRDFPESVRSKMKG